MVITELAVFENRNGKLVLIEIANETTFDEVDPDDINAGKVIL